MADLILYTVKYFGVDGRDKPSTVFASFYHNEVEEFMKNKGNYSSCYLEFKTIVDTKKDLKGTYSKLPAELKAIIELVYGVSFNTKEMHATIDDKNITFRV